MERTAAGWVATYGARRTLDPMTAETDAWVIALTHSLAALAERRPPPLESFMIGPCMPHQRLDAVPVVAAAVIHLPDYQERRMAGDIIADCPGWHVWYSGRLAQWIAHRCGGPGCEDSADPALVSIAAADPGELLARIGERALSDLATDLPEWEVTCTDDGFWWASETGPDDGRCRGVICATSPVRLSIAVRAYVDLMSRQPDLRPVGGDGPRC